MDVFAFDLGNGAIERGELVNPIAIRVDKGGIHICASIQVREKS